MAESSLKSIKEGERKEHDITYGELAKDSLKKYTPESYVEEMATPSYMPGGAVSGDINKIFIDRMLEVLASFGRKDIAILDYGCGMGKLSVFLAQNGYTNIKGFDLSAEGVKFGNELAKFNGVDDKVELKPMDGEALEYADNTFDVVIGKSVLHHTIKYPKTAEELYRVVKPGGIVLFKENLGNNPVMKFARWITMGVFGHHGDVNITTKMFRKYCERFSSAEIEAYYFTYMAKRILWKANRRSGVARDLMKMLKSFDEATVHKSKKAREYLCGDAIFTIKK